MLELNNISHYFGQKQILNDFSLRLAPGERIAVMGPSGCGKTTLLRIVLALQTPDRGDVRCSWAKTAAVFQEPRLLPWRTAEENVNLVLSDREETMPQARTWLKLLELSDSYSLFPAELSGGMQQRVSIARALASEPELLVMDEPFKAMDSALHERVLDLTGKALKNTTLMLATHSKEEALALGCRILHYENGQFR